MDEHDQEQAAGNLKSTKEERRMLHKIALIESISRKTADQLHQYLMDFAEGTHRMFWVDNRAYVEVHAMNDADLIRREFPALVRKTAQHNSARFPW